MATETAPWLTGFDDFRVKQIDPLLVELETARKAARAAAWERAKWVVPVVLSLLLILFYFIPGDFAFFGAFVAAGLAWAYIQSPIADNQKLVKQKLATALCGFFGLEFDMVPKRNPIPDLSAVQLLPGHNRDAIEDQVSGAYQGVRLEMTDLHLRDVSGEGKDRRDVTVFRGPAFNFSFAKRFNGTTIIKTNGSLIGNWLEGFSMKDKERIRLEDPHFEKCFEVYGTDQVEARYLLTPGFMEHLLALRESLGDKMQAAFSGENFYVVANNNQNRFEVKGLSSATINTQLDQFIGDIGILFRVIETLNLDSKTRL